MKLFLAVGCSLLYYRRRCGCDLNYGDSTSVDRDALIYLTTCSYRIFLEFDLGPLLAIFQWGVLIIKNVKVVQQMC